MLTFEVPYVRGEVAVLDDRGVRPDAPGDVDRLDAGLRQGLLDLVRVVPAGVLAVPAGLVPRHQALEQPPAALGEPVADDAGLDDRAAVLEVEAGGVAAEPALDRGIRHVAAEHAVAVDPDEGVV